MEDTNHGQSGIHHGHITSVGKHYYSAELERDKGSYFRLEGKVKKLSQKQREILAPGAYAKIDAEKRIIFIMGPDGVWY